MGVNLPNSDFLGGPMGQQMRGRVTMHEIAPYTVGSQVDREQWERLIQMFELEFLLADHDVGVVAAEAAWLHQATGGVIGALRTLLRKAQVSAILDDKEYVDAKRLKSAQPDWQSEYSAKVAQQAAARPPKSKPPGRRRSN